MSYVHTVLYILYTINTKRRGALPDGNPRLLGSTSVCRRDKKNSHLAGPQVAGVLLVLKHHFYVVCRIMTYMHTWHNTQVESLREKSFVEM